MIIIISLICYIETLYILEIRKNKKVLKGKNKTINDLVYLVDTYIKKEKAYKEQIENRQKLINVYKAMKRS